MRKPIAPFYINQWRCAFCSGFNALRNDTCATCGRDVESEYSWCMRNYRRPTLATKGN